MSGYIMFGCEKKTIVRTEDFDYFTVDIFDRDEYSIKLSGTWYQFRQATILKAFNSKIDAMTASGKNLFHFDISGMEEVGDAYLQAIFHKLNSLHIESIKLSSLDLRNPEVVDGLKCILSSGLKAVDLSNSNVTLELIESINGIKLIDLNIGNCKIEGFDDARILKYLTKTLESSPALYYLNLNNILSNASHKTIKAIGAKVINAASKHRLQHVLSEDSLMAEMAFRLRFAAALSLQSASPEAPRISAFKPYQSLFNVEGPACSRLHSPGADAVVAAHKESQERGRHFKVILSFEERPTTPKKQSSTRRRPSTSSIARLRNSPFLYSLVRRKERGRSCSLESVLKLTELTQQAKIIRRSQSVILFRRRISVTTPTKISI